MHHLSVGRRLNDAAVVFKQAEAQQPIVVRGLFFRRNPEPLIVRIKGPARLAHVDSSHIATTAGAASLLERPGVISANPTTLAYVLEYGTPERLRQSGGFSDHPGLPHLFHKDYSTPIRVACQGLGAEARVPVRVADPTCIIGGFPVPSKRRNGPEKTAETTRPREHG